MDTSQSFSGNPLTCDCNTLWLRNWVSSANANRTDEPRCYFPKALSGNPLRQLRTSRFRCDDHEDEAFGAGSNGRRAPGDGGFKALIKDACSGIPLKPPFQETALVHKHKQQQQAAAEGSATGAEGGAQGKPDIGYT